MDPAGWQRAKPIIEEALQLSGRERRAFIASACESEELRREIEVLLESYEQVDARPSTRSEPATAHADTLGVSLSNHEPQTGVSTASALVFDYPPGVEMGGRYVLTDPLGKGGGGEVHRAHDVRLQREVAIKILPARGHVDGARQIREARAAAQLNHRGIATIHDVFDIDGRPAIVMELVPGPTLAERIRNTALPAAEAIDVGVQIADAVEHAHAFGILHCDLKPGNVKFAADGTVKVLDFGLARRTENSAVAMRGVTGLSAGSLDGLALGTPGYMSPELLMGIEIDFRSDVYSLGVLVYEMTSGRRLFTGVDQMSAAVAVLTTPAAELPRDVPRRLRQVVQRALNRKPSDRFPSAAEFRDALAAARVRTWRERIASIFRR